MTVQSLSIVVPNRACINHCASCPSRMHDNNYPMLIDENLPDFDLYFKDYMKRLEFAKDKGCDTLMLTGTSEPQQNRKFLLWFGMMMQMMKNPFMNIEMQCTGALIDRDYLTFMRRHVGVTLMALSVFSLENLENNNIISPPKNVYINVQDVARMVKSAGMSLRMCLNMTSYFDEYEKDPEKLFGIMKIFGADQITLRVLYASEPDEDGSLSLESKWVKENAASIDTVAALNTYVKRNGRLLGKLPYGASRYDLNGMSVVIDCDSMGKEPEASDTYKYLILRPDCRLYSSWDSHASMIF